MKRVMSQSPFCDFLPLSWDYDGALYVYSGYVIAAKALTAVIRAHDGRDSQTMLTDSILQSPGLPYPDELIMYRSHLLFESYFTM